MLWEAVLLGSEIFHDEPGNGLDWYEKFVKSNSFQKLQSPEQLNIQGTRELIKFVNRWSTRYQSKPSELLTALAEVIPAFQALTRWNLLDVDFEQLVCENHTAADVIQWGFDEVLKCGKRTESTGTSKILHMINPSLFTMWDQAIRAGYAASNDGRGYARQFLPRAQRVARYAVKELRTMKKISEPEAVKYLCGCGHSLAMVIDEYNWIKFYKGRDEVWDLEFAER